LRVWDIRTGEAVTFVGSDEYLTTSSKGFFVASSRGAEDLSVVRGLEAYGVGEIYQSLASPDLVREALGGDVGGEVQRAAAVLDLDKVLDSGPAPKVEIISHPSEAQSATDVVTVAARISDRGKGIGHIEWRVNGVTVGVADAPAGATPVYEARQEIALDPGANAIEVVAYNARNLLASLPAQTLMTYNGPAAVAKPKLHILAIGINAYMDKGWTPPGTSLVEAFSQLGLAVGDAKSFAAEMQKAAAGLYGEVRVRTALDAEATSAGLDKIVEEFAAGIGPRDTFVLYAAAHGCRARLFTSGPILSNSTGLPGWCGSGGAGRAHHRTGAPAGLDRQPHQGEASDHPARHLRVRCTDQRVRPQPRRCAGLRGRHRAVARSDGPRGADRGCGG
jgi:hypothetical protein